MVSLRQVSFEKEERDLNSKPLRVGVHRCSLRYALPRGGPALWETLKVGVHRCSCGYPPSREEDQHCGKP